MLPSSSKSSLSQRLCERILTHLQPQPELPAFDINTNNLLFIGNWHDSIPRALVLDPLLQSTDKCVYLLLRTYLSAVGARRMPSYQEIGQLLGLSRGTIARSLHILRAARWITLCNSLRDESTGRFKGNTYAIHDEVLSIEEAMVLDGHYIEALEQMEQHRHHRVRMVAYVILENLRTMLSHTEPEQSDYPGTSISRFMHHPPHGFGSDEGIDVPQAKNPRGNVEPKENKADHPVQKSTFQNGPEQGVDNDRKNFLNSSANKEKQALNIQVQNSDLGVFNLDSVQTERSSSFINNIKTTTTPPVEKISNGTRIPGRERIDPDLIWPNGLTGDGQWVAWQSLRKCPQEHRQDLLDELAARMAPSSPRTIQNPAGWLAWASKELRDDGIYPITNLGIKHRQCREREQQRQQVDQNKKQSLMQQGQALMEKNQLSATAKSRENKYKMHVATLKAALHQRQH